MSLIAQIKADQVSARKQKLSEVAAVLTTLIGEAEMIGKNAGREVTDAEVVKKVKSFIENLNVTIKAVGENDPRALKAMGERLTLEKYLPKQLTEDEIKGHVRDIHAGLLGAGLPAGMKDIMGMLKQRFDGLYDGKVASAAVKESLENH